MIKIVKKIIFGLLYLCVGLGMVIVNKLVFDEFQDSFDYLLDD